MTESRSLHLKKYGSAAWLIALLLLLPGASRAADGTLDTAFGSNHTGLVLTDAGGNGFPSEAAAIAIQPDDKIIVAGDNLLSGSSDFALARYNPDGTLDDSFGSNHNGVVLTDFSGSGSQDDAFAVAIQSDGKIVAAGESRASGSYDFALARYNPDGTLDTSFGSNHDGLVLTDFSGSGSLDVAHAVTVQSDGKIVAAGYSSASGGYDFALARYNSDGTLDTSFGSNHDGRVLTDFSGSVSHDDAYAVAVQSDGKIVAAGQSDAEGDYEFALARYNSDGTLDTSFGSNATGLVTSNFRGGSKDFAYGLAIQTDGKIVAAGESDLQGGSASDFALARYNLNGTLDTSFGSNATGLVLTDFSGSGPYSYAFGVAIQVDGKIVAAGNSGTTDTGDFALARYSSNGTLDTSFGGGGTGLVLTDFSGSGSYDYANAVAIQSDGKIVAAGTSDASGHGEFALARYQATSAPASACASDATHLCLLGDRFRVSVEWTDYNTDITAPATAVPFKDGSGFFYFNDANKIEVMVQVKNACQGFRHFWVFYAATTNVGYSLTVTDTTISQTETYSNPAHSLAVAGTDETSFGACP
ncbi:MAG TPA: delta-60 repeat domain-containing protein [Thermoanaerobaculia bacterium]|nr:delta-60 repeat domain-containing protein [Thermoanaerobaculia bacterium]